MQGSFRFKLISFQTRMETKMRFTTGAKLSRTAKGFILVIKLI